LTIAVGIDISAAVNEDVNYNTLAEKNNDKLMPTTDYYPLKHYL